jgi:transposase-like protein
VPSDPQKPSQSPSGHEEEPTAQPMPRCPNCGWKNVRISHNKGLLDTILAAMSIQRFKCRTCGRYFRHRYRIVE